MSNINQELSIKDFFRTITRLQMQSSYKTEYLGTRPPISDNFRKARALPAFRARKEGPNKSEYTLFYQLPQYEINELRTYGRRYSCNKYNHLPAKGISPNHSSFWYDFSRNFPRIRSAI
jgi:hypothetical protein